MPESLIDFGSRIAGSDSSPNDPLQLALASRHVQHSAHIGL